VGIPPNGSVAECKLHVNNTLVNIVDLIGARRMGKKVEVWNDFEAFCDYTLQDEHRIDAREANKDGGFFGVVATAPSKEKGREEGRCWL